MADAPEQTKLKSARAYVLAAAFKLRDDGAQHVGAIQHYASEDVAREFTVKFNGILGAIEAWGVAAGRLLKLSPPNHDQLLQMKALATEGFALGKAINKFNAAAWWTAPSKASLVIRAPFEVAAHVTIRVAQLAEQAGQSVLKVTQFAAGNLGWLLAAAGIFYFAAPVVARAWAGRKAEA